MDNTLKSILVYSGVFIFVGFTVILLASFIDAQWHFDIMSWTPEARFVWLVVCVLMTGASVDVYKTMKEEL